MRRATSADLPAVTVLLRALNTPEAATSTAIASIPIDRLPIDRNLASIMYLHETATASCSSSGAERKNVRG